MIVGARYVCGRCRVRGWTLPCPRCGRERMDLASDDAPDALAREWPSAGAWRAGRSILSPLAIRHDRPVLLIALAFAAVVVLGGPARAMLDGRPLLEAGLVVLVGLVLSPLLVAFFAVQLFYTAHLLRLVALLYLGLGSLLPFVGGGLVLIGSLLEWLGSRLVPRIVLEDPRAPREVRGTARLTSPLEVRVVSDAWGWMERGDAWASCDGLVLDGESLRLDLAAGVIEWGPSALDLPAEARAIEPAAGPGAYRGADGPGAPPWTRAPARERAPRKYVVPPGREVVVRGGRAERGVLSGTREAPLFLELR